MKIKRIVVGYLQENCYILEKNGKIIIIDPGAESKKILANIDGEVEEILITHYHFDHIGALEELKKKYHIKENIFLKKNFNYEVIKTPGHTSDSLCFYFKEENVMFTGDLLFANSIGRMDLPTGSVSCMVKSIYKIDKYSKDIKIYPGHGDTTSLGLAVNIAKEILDL